MITLMMMIMIIKIPIIITATTTKTLVDNSENDNSMGDSREEMTNKSNKNKQQKGIRD